eukprot:TRINITY_DN147_c0_g1_i1.p1 TRINITY_DN147_c0_g1~~TRINITY_DN147_c0_g1_i1.p1  ORF type:complete len:344 (-),score=98.34 TRINITY_DN147_c0_g1_i1:1201-2232(-)
MGTCCSSANGIQTPNGTKPPPIRPDSPVRAGETDDVQLAIDTSPKRRGINPPAYSKLDEDAQQSTSEPSLSASRSVVVEPEDATLAVVQEEVKSPPAGASIAPVTAVPAKSESALVITDENSISLLPDRLQKVAKLALHGNPEAQFTLAFAFDQGDGVEVNTNEALRFYTLAAQNGNASAQNNLGVLYATGHKNRIQKNTKMAYRWYKAAAENGSAVGQFHVSLLSLTEESGFKPNREYSYQMLKRSARQHYTMAQAMLGTAYLEGKICNVDLEKGIKLLKRAGEAEDPVALYNLAVAYKSGTGVTSDPDRANAYFELAKSSKAAMLFTEFSRDEVGDTYIRY